MIYTAVSKHFNINQSYSFIKEMISKYAKIKLTRERWFSYKIAKCFIKEIVGK